MAKRKTISESEVKAIVQAEIANADGYGSSLVSIERAANLDAYHGRLYGTEIEGRSKVVSSDVRDTVEWIMPTMMRIFTSGDTVVDFSPEEESDIPFAKQATEYVNFIWNRDNKGFLNTYSWTKDGILEKNGVVKIWWDEAKATKRQRYSGLDADAFAQAVNPDDMTVSEHTENDDDTHDVVLTKTKPKKRVCVFPIPPEEFIISRDGRDIQTARLVGHRRLRTLSDLREDGFPKAKIDTIASGAQGDTYDTNAEAIARNTVEDQTDGEDNALNTAMRQVWVTEAYIKIDVDGDGIAEMRKVTCAGPGCEILSNEAWDGLRPFASWTPIIMPHRFYGQCPADLIKDLQLIKTTLLRQLLDNVYLSNNQREEVVADNIIDPDELLSSAPGRKIRVKAIDSIRPILVPNITSQCIEGLQYIDQIKENRTGVSERTQGLGANTLHDTLGGERLLLSAAMSKIELIARIFAETGFKDAFKLILDLICRYQDEPRTVRLTNKQFVAFDPRGAKWNPDMDLEVHVALGMGDRDQQLAHAQLLTGLQSQAIKLGYVSPDNLKSTAELAIGAMGLKGVEQYFTFPDGEQAKQPIKLPPPPQKTGTDPQTLIQMEQIKAQAKIQSTQVQAQAKAATDAHLNQAELQRHTMENQQQMKLEAFKAQMQAALDLAIAHIKADAQIEAAQVTAGADDGSDDVAYHRARESA